MHATSFLLVLILIIYATSFLRVLILIIFATADHRYDQEHLWAAEFPHAPV